MVPTARSPPQLMAIMDTTLVLMDYTQEQIERIAEFASDAANLKPAGPEAWEWGRQAGDAIADTFTDEDWETLLNRLSPDRAARHITFRPPEDRQHLLSLVSPDRRAAVEAYLSVTA